jgi:UDP-N-acetylglucosamine 2-epimerase (non-hydrolysing)
MKRQEIHWLIICLIVVVLVGIHKGSYEPSVSDSMTANTGVSAHGTCQQSEKKRLLFFFGTRPEAIKMGPIIQRATQEDAFQVINVFTGQHVDIIMPFVAFFEITIHHTLDTRSHQQQSVSLLLSRLVTAIETNIPACKDDIWVVQGDTTTALAAAMVAFSHHVALAHVEAGLRTYDVQSPFPEEFNRRAISLMSSYNFAPSQLAYENLKNEGVRSDTLHVTGNTVIDAVRQFSNHARRPRALDFDTAKTRLVFVSMHRRENFARIAETLETINAVTCIDCVFVVPLHPNQNSAKPMTQACSRYTRFKCIPGLNVDEMYWVLAHAHFIMTDSGGVQEEASWFRKPVLVLRDKTERMESVHAGVSVLIAQNATKMRFYMERLLDTSSDVYARMTQPAFPYGHGFASAKILTALSASTHRTETQGSMHRTEHVVQHGTIYLDRQSMPACAPRKDPVRFACFRPKTIGVILTVYKRNNLSRQLEAAASQTMQPLVIHVHHNDVHISNNAVSTDISKFETKYPHIRVAYTHYLQNSRFHARFFTAYMLDTEFVSVWDDDQMPPSPWLERSVELSLQNSDALVGAHAYNVREITSEGVVLRTHAHGFVDVVGHIWTLRREYIRFFLGDLQFTYTTGEDIQLSFSLQKRNILTVFMLKNMGVKTPDTSDSGSAVASYKTTDPKYHATRNLLWCQVIKAGYQTRQCDTCNAVNIDACIRYYTGVIEA